jgi:hypothetical protein
VVQVQVCSSRRPQQQQAQPSPTRRLHFRPPAPNPQTITPPPTNPSQPKPQLPTPSVHPDRPNPRESAPPAGRLLILYVLAVACPESGNRSGFSSRRSPRATTARAWPPDLAAAAKEAPAPVATLWTPSPTPTSRSCRPWTSWSACTATTATDPTSRTSRSCSPCASVGSPRPRIGSARPTWSLARC